jgi:TetR/AcrR family transcriptional regulator, cholesterol catabolism regulator
MLDNTSTADGSEARSRAAGYASPSIVARRHRILDVTRRMIGQVGIANLSMDDVAEQANVAKRTLYNAFQSKEHLVALAISKYFEDYASKIDYSTQVATLEWMIERLVIVARRNLSIRNYTRALMNIYHSSDVDPEIRQAIHDIAAKSHEPWILELDRKRQLQPWIDAEDLIANLVRYRYAAAHAWAEGLIPEDQLVIELLRGFLTFMAGATTGVARRQIVEVLTNLEDHPLLREPNSKAGKAKKPS